MCDTGNISANEIYMRELDNTPDAAQIFCLDRDTATSRAPRAPHKGTRSDPARNPTSLWQLIPISGRVNIRHMVFSIVP